MGSFLLQFVTGCCHRHQTRPFTLDRHTYKVCLDCGNVIAYSLERMASCGSWKQGSLKGGETGRSSSKKARTLGLDRALLYRHFYERASARAGNGIDRNTAQQVKI